MASQFQLIFLWCIILYSDQVAGLPVSPVQCSTEQWDSQPSVSSDIDITQAPGPGWWDIVEKIDTGAGCFQTMSSHETMIQGVPNC